MASKFIEKFHSLRDEYHFDDDVDIDIQFEYKYINYGNTQIYILSVAKFKKKEAIFPKYVESLIKIFEINKLLVDLWNYEPDIYDIIAEMVLGVKEVMSFTNASFINAIRDMTYDDAIKKHGDPKFWDITEVTDHSVFLNQKYKFSSQFWNLHPIVKRSDLIFHMPKKYNYSYNNYSYNSYNYYYSYNNYDIDHIVPIPIIGKNHINFETEEEEGKKKRTKIIHKAHRKEHQKIIKRQNRMSYKNNKCKSHYR